MTYLPKIKINRENIVLISILVILVAIPLTVILLGVRQELRKRAEGVNGSILINNGAETTSSRNVTLTLTAPTGSQSFFKFGIPQAYAANYCGGNCSSKSSCPATCISGNIFYYNLGGCSSSARCYYNNTYIIGSPNPPPGAPGVVPTPTTSQPLGESCHSACRGAGYTHGSCERIDCDCWRQENQPCGWLAGGVPGSAAYTTCAAISAQTRLTHRCCCYGGTPASGCRSHCESLGHDWGMCLLDFGPGTGCSNNLYTVRTSWSGCPSQQTPVGEVPGLCCCSGSGTSGTTPTAPSDSGCGLSCSASKGFATCSVSVDPGIPTQWCKILWDGKPTGGGGCTGFGHQFCFTGSTSGTHTATVEVWTGDFATGEKVASCSNSVYVDCNFENASPVCSSINGPSQVEPGSTHEFTTTASDPDGDDLIYYWTATCGSDLSGHAGNTITWTAPSESTTCTISVYASDGYGEEHGSIGHCPDKIVTVGGGGSGLAAPPSEEISMMISNCGPDCNFSDGVEEPFATTKSWTLTEGDGLKTVWAKFKVGGVWTTPVSDSITLDTGGPTPTPTPTPTTPAEAPTPTPTPLPVPTGWEAADLNGDGGLDIFDFVVFLETYDQSGENLRGDLDGDGTVTILDVSIFIGLYQEYVLGR